MPAQENFGTEKQHHHHQKHIKFNAILTFGCWKTCSNILITYMSDAFAYPIRALGLYFPLKSCRVYWDQCTSYQAQLGLEKIEEKKVIIKATQNTLYCTRWKYLDIWMNGIEKTAIAKQEMDLIKVHLLKKILLSSLRRWKSNVMEMTMMTTPIPTLTNKKINFSFT